MRRLERVKEKVLGFSLGGGLVVGFDVGFDGFAGSFIAGLLSALECAGCGARCMLVSDRDERALLSENRSRRDEA